MEINKLEAFCKVVELKSFTRAAEAVLLTQPTVSEHVRSLEEELGQKLLDRLGKAVEPTPVGRLFYRYARKILQAKREAVQAVEQYSGSLVGRIMVGCSTIPGAYVLPELIGRFRRQHPSIKTTLRISSSHIISGQVLEGELDMGVVGAKWNESGLSWTEMFHDELTLVVHPDHPWARGKAVALAAIVKEPFIMREAESGTRKVFSNILEKNGTKESELREVAEIGSTEAIKEAVKAGIGISILSRCAIMDDINSGRLAAVAIKGQVLERPFYLVQRKNRALSPVASVFLEYLHENSDSASAEKTVV
ncbi:MAG: LysR family transcriptional regulator [Desulfocapsa sp.]|nr:LysR family transcriptional regulator [Desulfocapsa sp.]